MIQFAPNRRSVAFRTFATTAVAVFVSASALSVFASPAQAASAKAGRSCTKAGQKSGSLTCTRVNGKLVWRTSSKTTTKAVTTVAKATETTVPAAAAPGNAIEGTWKPTSASTVGYRVKEILQGQPTEGVGRTNAVSGSMVIKGTTVTSADFTADLTTLKSDSTFRDRRIKSDFLESDKFPEAKLKLRTPIELGAVPGDKEEVKKSAAVSLTLHGVTKDFSIDITARRNGANVELLGATNIVFADYNIEKPDIAGQVTTDPNGLLEFLIVLAR
jgi:polyisoprenoid-binding protein YceI